MKRDLEASIIDNKNVSEFDLDEELVIDETELLHNSKMSTVSVSSAVTVIANG